MAKTEKISRKAALKQVEKKLTVTFGSLETILGNKDFKKRMKKAGKALIKGLKNKQGALALANLEKSGAARNANEPHKKNGMKAYPEHTVVSHKRKTVEANDSQ